MASERLLVVGKIVGLYGVQGWVKLESYTEPRTKIFSYRPWSVSLADGDIGIDDVQGREQGKGLVGRLAGYNDRDAAATLIGASIRIPRSALPKSVQGEYYWADLENLAVVTNEGVPLGTVSHLFATAANDVMVVKDATRERLIPFVQGQFIEAVDLENSRITVDWDPDF
ncbi:MAG TPA: ribosome maturation factor RimM [Rudaea sp.]|nr:ribosome maturation factor RimM [Rudaea sp.]